MPRLRSHEVNKMLQTDQLDPPKARPRRLPSEGKAKLESLHIEQVDTPHVDPEWAAQMMFNQEKVSFIVLPDANKNAENPILCQNNGENAPVQPRPGWLYRDQEYTVERRFLESLLRAKIISYTQRKETDPNGIQQIVNIPSVAPRYQVRVTRDDNPLGGAWLKSISMQAP